MWELTVRRLFQAIFVLLAVSFISFAVFQFTGDPVDAMVGRHTKQATRERLRERLGLDEPFYIQYMVYLKNVAHGDFGTSYEAKVSALDLILDRFPASFELALASVLFSVSCGLILGVWTAIRPESFFSSTIMSFSLLGISLPTFLTGILLMLLFGVQLGWLPVFGRGETTKLIGNWETGYLTISGLKHILLPAITMGMFQMATLLRLTRSNMLETLQNDYITTARAKGLSERIVVFKHALRNALIPVVTIIGLNFGGLLAFATITETVFQWPGMGNLLLTSFYENDRPVMVAFLSLIAFVIVIINLLVDISYAVINPKIRYE